MRERWNIREGYRGVEEGYIGVDAAWEMERDGGEDAVLESLRRMKSIYTVEILEHDSVTRDRNS